jgi:CopG antitoxin of type II toxin-antitoxin system
MTHHGGSAVTGDDDDDGLTVVGADDRIPPFANEAEEHVFWSTHAPSSARMAAARANPAFAAVEGRLPPVRLATGTASISLRIERDVLADVRALAAQRGIAYQTLLKRFIIERLYEERKRENA